MRLLAEEYTPHRIDQAIEHQPGSEIGDALSFEQTATHLCLTKQPSRVAIEGIVSLQKKKIQGWFTQE